MITIKINKRYSLKRQQGVVIVVALFIVALVVTMAYVMMSRLERDTRRTSLLLRDTQAELYAQGSIAWAIEQLKENLAKQKPNHRVDNMPMKSPVNTVNGYAISSTIYDMQSRFNLNNMTNPDAQADFKRLLQLVNPKITEQKAQEIMLAIVDWMTPGQQQNEYNKYYMDLMPPYRAAHRPMVSASELQLVKGMSPPMFDMLQPFVTALPAETKVNVHTMMAPVMACLTPGMTLDTGKEIEKIRGQSTVSSKQAFLNLDVVKNHTIPPDKLTDISNYFLVETKVTIENQNVVLYTLLERASKEKISKIWQSKGLPG